MFREADRAISYVADVESRGLKAFIETVSQGPRSFFIVHLTSREEVPGAELIGRVSPILPPDRHT